MSACGSYVTNAHRCDPWGSRSCREDDDVHVIWIALVLPLLVLPALLAFSRFEQVMLTAPRVRETAPPPVSARPERGRSLNAG